ncbi:hypothetical protein QL285_070323 [Trifolium repens]|nr:hypothetical protein QL285_070323 [Trifolium repens]
MENRRQMEHQRERRAQYERNRRQRMNSEQRQQELLRRRENYNQSHNFSSNFQGTHDFEAGPSVRHINDTTVGHNFSSNFQGTHDFEAGPSGTNVDNIVNDSMDFDDNFAESPMPYVDMEVTASCFQPWPVICGFISRCFTKFNKGHNFSSNFQGTHDFEAGPSGTNVDNIVNDSMDFDDNFAESPMPYVDMEVTASCFQPWPVICGFISRCFTKFNKGPHQRWKTTK